MAELWGVDSLTAEGILVELAENVESRSGLMSGGLDYAREVLVHLVGPERAEEILGALVSSGEFRPFEFLRRTPPEQIRTFLSDEAPQTVALVLASLYSGLSGRVLAELPPELQADVAARIALMGETNPEVIADVDAGLRSKLSAISTK
jgi:flagellar motor switch protein FliG